MCSCKCPCVTVTDGCDEIGLNRLWFLSSSPPLWECTDSVCLSDVFDQKSAEILCFELNHSCGKFLFCCLGQYLMEAILYSQNSWNMVGTFYMWRWISCCFLELWGYVCRYRSQSVDLRSYKYSSMRLCCCLCTQVHRCSCSVTFSSSDRCTL